MLLFIPLEPDLGSRIVELESIIHKRLSRRDSGFYLVENRQRAACCRVVRTIRGLRFPNDPPTTAFTRISRAVIRIDPWADIWIGAGFGPLLHKTPGRRKKVNPCFHHGLGIDPYCNSDFGYFANS